MWIYEICFIVVVSVRVVICVALTVGERFRRTDRIIARSSGPSDDDFVLWSWRTYEPCVPTVALRAFCRAIPQYNEVRRRFGHFDALFT